MVDYFTNETEVKNFVNEMHKAGIGVLFIITLFFRRQLQRYRKSNQFSRQDPSPDCKARLEAQMISEKSSHIV